MGDCSGLDQVTKRDANRFIASTAALPTDGADEPRGEGWVRVFGAPSSCLALFGRTIHVPSLWNEITLFAMVFFP